MELTTTTTPATIDATVTVWEGSLIAEARTLVEASTLLTIEGCAEGPKKGYDAVHAMHMKLVSFRTDGEKTRKEIKQPFLDACKKIDGIMPQALALTAPEEDRLKSLKDVYNAAEKAEKEAKEKAKKDLLASRFARLTELGCAINPVMMYEATEKQWAEVIAKAEEEYAVHIESERLAKIEADRLHAEKVEAERIAKVETDRIEAERKAEADRIAKIESDRLAAERAEEHRIAMEKVESEKKIEAERKIESDRIATEQAEANRIESERIAKEREEIRARQAVIDAENKAKQDALDAKELEIKKITRKANDVIEWKSRIMDVVQSIDNDTPEVETIRKAIIELLAC
jgi:hypothetical protein